MKKTFNFQELIKYIEDNKITTCKIKTEDHVCNSLGELLNCMHDEYYDYALFEELNKMKYIVDVKGMTFDEVLEIYRQNTATYFEVYIEGEKVYTDTLSVILAGRSGAECYDILNFAEFFISKN